MHSLAYKFKSIVLIFRIFMNGVMFDFVRNILRGAIRMSDRCANYVTQIIITIQSRDGNCQTVKGLLQTTRDRKTN